MRVVSAMDSLFLVHKRSPTVERVTWRSGTEAGTRTEVSRESLRALAYAGLHPVRRTLVFQDAIYASWVIVSNAIQVDASVSAIGLCLEGSQCNQYRLRYSQGGRNASKTGGSVRIFDPSNSLGRDCSNA